MHLLRHRKIPREHDAYLEEMKMKFAKRAAEILLLERRTRYIEIHFEEY